MQTRFFDARYQGNSSFEDLFLAYFEGLGVPTVEALPLLHLTLTLAEERLASFLLILSLAGAWERRADALTILIKQAALETYFLSPACNHFFIDIFTSYRDYRQDAEDLAQGATLRAILAIYRGQIPAQNLKGWLRRLATNLLLDHHRSHRRRLPQGCQIQGVPREALGPSQEEEARIRETLELVFQRLGKQTGEIVLRAYQGYTQEESARHSSQSERTIRRHLDRAYEFVKRLG